MNFVCSSSNVFAKNKNKLDKFCGGFCTNNFNGIKWFIEFHSSRISTNDSENSDPSVELATPETIEQMHDMVLVDRTLKIREISKAIGRIDHQGNGSCDNFE